MWLWVVIGSVIILAIYQYFVSRNQIFRTLKIPSVPGKLLFGNLLEAFGKPLALALRDWTSKYGSVYGYMEGGNPVLVLSDPDLLQEIFVKRFSIFHARKQFPLQPNPDTAENVSVFTARGKRWKRLRSIANPTFSAVKLKHMVPTVNDSIRTMIKYVEDKRQQGAEFDIYPFYQRFTLDVIAKTAFGYTKSIQGQEDNELTQLCKSIFGAQTIKKNFFSLLAMILPEFVFLWSRLNKLSVIFRKIPFLVIQKKLKVIVEDRRVNKHSFSQARLDFIQLLLEAEDEIAISSEDPQQLHMRNIQYNKKLTSQEIVSQSVVFLIAGYETTSTALAFTTYLLASNPEVQDKLRKEIAGCWDGASPLEYDTVMKMEYLDSVIKEALRLYPIGSAVQSRTCMEAVQIGNIYIPQGMVVAADVMNVHYNKELWGEDANEFRPERHLEVDKSSIHPMAWIPFGAGPRSCIGLRFAMMEEKLALTKLLTNFRFVATNKTTMELKGSSTISPKDVTVKVEKIPQ